MADIIENTEVNETPRREGALHYDYIETCNADGKKEEIGKTVATLDDCYWDVFDVIFKLLRNSNTNLTLNLSFNDEIDGVESSKRDLRLAEKYMLRNRFSAWSKANITKGDTYDKETGENLAKERCLAKYHKQFNRKLCNFLSETRFLCATIEHYMEKHNIDYSKVQSVDDMKKTKLS